MIRRHGGTPNKAGDANNQTTMRLSTAQGCVSTDTHCMSLNGAALQGTPSSQPTPVTAPNNPKPAQPQDLSTSKRSDRGIDRSTPAIIDDALAIKTPFPQDLLKDATEKFLHCSFQPRRGLSPPLNKRFARSRDLAFL
jgi:hypothetical protein